MPSSGAVIHMLCSAQRPQAGDGKVTGVPDRRRTLDGFLASIWPWGRPAVGEVHAPGDADVPAPGKQEADTGQ